MATIIVFGGTGYTGGNIVREAASRGHHVISMSRSEPAEPVEGVTYETGTVVELDGRLDAAAWQSGRSQAYADRWAAMATDRRPWRRSSRRPLVADFGERAAAYGYDLEDLDVLRPWEPAHQS